MAAHAPECLQVPSVPRRLPGQWRRRPMSLRMRFVAGLVGVAVTTGVFMLTALLYLKSVGPALDEIGRELQNDMLPMARLQLEIERAAMPANDFLITGDTSERTNFAAAEQQVNALFTQLMEEAPVTHSAEAALVARAHAVWRRAVPVARQLLAMADPTSDPAAPGMMQKMDDLLGLSADTLGEAYHQAQANVEEALAETKHASRAMVAIITALFVLVLTVVVAGGLQLGRAILTPVGLLVKAAEQFRQENLGHRVPQANMPGELAVLASALNSMACGLMAQRRALERLARHDELTGLYNRRAFEDFFAEDFARASRLCHSLCLLILDVDHFKSINDRWGHLAGDAVLRALSERLVENVREIDRVCRYGGEEIAILLPEADAASARRVAERLRRAAAAAPLITSEGQPISVRVSIGLATYPAHARTRPGLFEAADGALFRAKRGGRDRVVSADSVSVSAEPA